MARFDAHRRADAQGYMLDCQADILRKLNTRFVVPLQLPEEAPEPAGRLNPIFEIGGQTYVMVTQFATAVPVSELGAISVSLVDHDTAIMNALDMLLTGY